VNAWKKIHAAMVANERTMFSAVRAANKQGKRFSTCNGLWGNWASKAIDRLVEKGRIKYLPFVSRQNARSTNGGYIVSGMKLR
jgi:hypothetical protein